MKNFDLKKYLIENKLTKTSRLTKRFQENNSLVFSEPESEKDRIFRKNKEDILKLGLEGERDWKKGINVDYGPYKDKDSFEYMYWKKGWEEADLAASKRKNRK